MNSLSENFNSGRREFIQKSAFATAALSLPLSGCFNSRKPVVAVIGAGIAGLNTAYQLKKKGVECTIYEASNRIGGRVLTVDEAVIKGAHVDLGAEFVDTVHTDILTISKELNIELHDIREDTLVSKAYFFEGKMLTEEDVVKALQPFAEQLARDVQKLPDNLHYSVAESFQEFDNQSVTEYLKGIGIEGWLLRFFEVAMVGEYAMEAHEQSAVNLLIMLSIPIAYSDQYHLLGDYHEVFKFKGGSQSFIKGLQGQVEDRIKLGYQLKKLNRIEKRYELTFQQNGKNEVVEADYVVLAFSFTVLRKLEMNFEFPARKKQWIEEAGMGNAVKVAMGFKERVWRQKGYQGYTYTDVNVTEFWDSSMFAETEEGSLTFAGGGDVGNEFGTLSNSAIRERWLSGVDTIYHGVKDQHNERITKFVWTTYPFTNGSYTSYKKGQWSKFAGVEAEPYENILFAGEHCSVLHQGYMNGAAETGRVAAEEILKRLSLHS